jgi:hypothetical protein
LEGEAAGARGCSGGLAEPGKRAGTGEFTCPSVIIILIIAINIVIIIILFNL